VAHFGAGLFGCEHPFDAGDDGVALLLPDGCLGGQLLDTFDAAVKALGRLMHGRTIESDGRRESPCKNLHAQVSPPSVHQMVLTLERAGFMRRRPSTPRSIELLVDSKQLPELL